LVLAIKGTTKCTVEDLNATLPHQPTLFGVGIENGPFSVKNAFYWNNNTNATKVMPLAIQFVLYW